MKKVVGAVLCATMLLSSGGLTSVYAAQDVTTSRSSYLPGDANLDGYVSAADVAYVMQYVLNKGVPLNEEQFINADVDNDGYITYNDASIIMKMVLG